MMFSKKFLFLFIFGITLFSFIIRIYRIGEPNHYYFDEVYHAVTAKAYADHIGDPYNPFSKAPKEGTAYDWLHPPLAKLIQAGSIKIFGDEPLGWRLPSVIFGTAIIPATFVLAYLVFGPLAAIFAASVLALENLNLVMSRITMNDVFVTFFVIVACIFSVLYIRSSSRHPDSASAGEGSQLRKRFFGPAKPGPQNDTNGLKYLFLTSLFVGFAVGSKWTGLYGGVVVIFYILWSKFKEKSFDPRLILLFVIPPLMYLLSYSQYWILGYTVSDFIDLHKQIWWYQNRHDLEHSYGTTPLYCTPKGLNGPKTWCPWVLDARPVYFSYEEYGNNEAGYVYALGNPFIYWFGVVAISYLISRLTEKFKPEYLLILGGYFIFWFPWIFSPRILFMYHYLPSLPFLSVALGFALAGIYKTKYKILALVILAVFAVAFFYFYPISTGLPINIESINRYMWLKTWR